MVFNFSFDDKRDSGLLHGVYSNSRFNKEMEDHKKGVRETLKSGVETISPAMFITGINKQGEYISTAVPITITEHDDGKGLSIYPAIACVIGMATGYHTMGQTMPLALFLVDEVFAREVTMEDVIKAVERLGGHDVIANIENGDESLQSILRELSDKNSENDGVAIHGITLDGRTATSAIMCRRNEDNHLVELDHLQDARSLSMSSEVVKEIADEIFMSAAAAIVALEHSDDIEGLKQRLVDEEGLDSDMVERKIDKITDSMAYHIVTEHPEHLEAIGNASHSLAEYDSEDLSIMSGSTPEDTATLIKNMKKIADDSDKKPRKPPSDSTDIFFGNN